MVQLIPTSWSLWGKKSAVPQDAEQPSPPSKKKEAAAKSHRKTASVSECELQSFQSGHTRTYSYTAADSYSMSRPQHQEMHNAAKLQEA